MIGCRRCKARIPGRNSQAKGQGRIVIDREDVRGISETAYFLRSCRKNGSFFYYLKEEPAHVHRHRKRALPGGMRSQRVPFQLCSCLSAHRRRAVVLDPHALCAGALLRRWYAPRVRQSHASRREAQERHELLSGARHRHRRTGRHGKHRRRVRRYPDRRPRRDFLDVGHRLFRHGDHLRRGDARADHPAGG